MLRAEDPSIPYRLPLSLRRFLRICSLDREVFLLPESEWLEAEINGDTELKALQALQGILRGIRDTYPTDLASDENTLRTILYRLASDPTWPQMRTYWALLYKLGQRRVLHTALNYTQAT